MQADAIEGFFNWINERHAIYLRRLEGTPPPWTADPILQEYKFTNPFRENDRVTIWMRKHWTNEQDTCPHEEILFNTCMFRMVGTTEFASSHGWVTDWDPTHTKKFIQDRIQSGEKTFTGAYIITNQGIKKPKSEVVVDEFLTPIWEDRYNIIRHIKNNASLQKAHQKLGTYKGWGGGGFMAYEVVTDLMYTPVLPKPEDRYTWANAGPGAKRGLNRLHGRPLNQAIKPHQCNAEMRKLLITHGLFTSDYIPSEDVDMRTIEHSLCEWDKYERVRLGQGRPRAKFKPQQYIKKGGV